MNWKLIKLGALLTQSKELSTAPDANRRIRVKLNVGGVEKRPVSNDVEGATNYYIRKAGQFIFGTQNFHKGAFGVIPPELDGFETSSDIPSFDVSKDCLPDWILFYFKVGDRYKELEKLARGVGSKRVHPKQIFEIEIPVPPVAEQLTIIEQVQASAARQRMIVEESNYQLTHLTQLRQALLREAMQGQLLPQDPTDEPAALLLQQLQAAAKPGKGGRGKAGALFAEEAEAVEGPFKIPASWAWCELKQVVKAIFDGPFGSHLKTADYTNAGVRVIRLENLDYGKFKHDKTTYISLEKYEGLKQHTIYEGDIIVGSFIADGVKAVLIPQLGEIAIAKADCFCIRHNPAAVDNYFLTYLLSTDFISDGYLRIMRGMTRSRINTAQLKQTLIPLPPLAEQHRIVAKLEQLLHHCDALEQRIRESRRLAGQLLATALREALAPPAGATPPEAAEPELAEAEAPASHGRRATAGKQRKVPASMGPLFDQVPRGHLGA